MDAAPISFDLPRQHDGRLSRPFGIYALHRRGIMSICSGRARRGSNSPSISVAGAPASFTSAGNTTASTWTAGLGLEWAFSGNWSVRAEYDYIALPNQSLTIAPGTPTFGGDVISLNNRSLSTIALAVNYKFGGW